MARRTTWRALALLPALVLTAAGCAQSIAPTGADGELRFVEPGKLTTCTQLPYPPFQFDEGGKTTGFDVELVDLVARDLGLEQKFFDTPFEGIQSGEALNTRKCDVAAAAITITDARQQNMDFSDPYFDAKQALLVSAEHPYPDMAALRGKKLGVHLGTTGEDYAEEHEAEHGYEIVQYEDLGLLQNAVQSGKVDAGINDNGVMLDFAKKNPDTKVTAEYSTGEVYGVAVQRGNAQLVQKVNDSLRKARESGEYDRIYEKWFGKNPDQP
ncbi:MULTISPECIES: ABC transporter substrate-binding protein [unclassified Saccharopolyspora]|uniref:ABC transporter substrate-binding protein n=1 Tax=unclassified Saccharopolyspora TaxID=2646250 RepID=UPI001CD2A3FC|nr:MULTISPECIES: ABC transporter substrate-binding protein [unclassified Saccharopolyspora]MCA1189846.1 ABC transporter substrate-binding protein [Saccharopolyspora sp. 6T]MCA1196042.1 ABC transporter substrate-binding protein [Saccharopolyspora sp. 6V]MCA1229517.1 ABC transporter substrate-binding protein [Saccharopolyspora sp. 6M]MCA1283374.1 ABC transporter substrate-binding protein [Saccharopolyspora sp. 7B]